MPLNIPYNVINPEAPKLLDNEQLNVYVPNAGYVIPGIAAFLEDHFTIDQNAKVQIKKSLIDDIAKIGKTNPIVRADIASGESGLVGLANATSRRLDAFETETGQNFVNVYGHISNEDNKIYSKIASEDVKIYQKIQTERETTNGQIVDINNYVNNRESLIRTDLKGYVDDQNASQTLSLQTFASDKAIAAKNAAVNLLNTRVYPALDDHTVKLDYLTKFVEGEGNNYTIQGWDEFKVGLTNPNALILKLRDADTDEYIGFKDLKTGDYIYTLNASVPNFLYAAADRVDDNVVIDDYNETQLVVKDGDTIIGYFFKRASDSLNNLFDGHGANTVGTIQGTGTYSQKSVSDYCFIFGSGHAEDGTGSSKIGGLNNFAMGEKINTDNGSKSIFAFGTNVLMGGEYNSGFGYNIRSGGNYNFYIGENVKDEGSTAQYNLAIGNNIAIGGPDTGNLFVGSNINAANTVNSIIINSVGTLSNTAYNTMSNSIFISNNCKNYSGDNSLVLSKNAGDIYSNNSIFVLEDDYANAKNVNVKCTIGYLHRTITPIYTNIFERSFSMLECGNDAKLNVYDSFVMGQIAKNSSLSCRNAFVFGLNKKAFTLENLNFIPGVYNVLSVTTSNVEECPPLVDFGANYVSGGFAYGKFNRVSPSSATDLAVVMGCENLVVGDYNYAIGCKNVIYKESNNNYVFGNSNNLTLSTGLYVLGNNNIDDEYTHASEKPTNSYVFGSNWTIDRDNQFLFGNLGDYKPLLTPKGFYFVTNDGSFEVEVNESCGFRSKFMEFYPMNNDCVVENDVPALVIGDKVEINTELYVERIVDSSGETAAIFGHKVWIDKPLYAKSIYIYSENGDNHSFCADSTKVEINLPIENAVIKEHYINAVSGNSSIRTGRLTLFDGGEDVSTHQDYFIIDPTQCWINTSVSIGGSLDVGNLNGNDAIFNTVSSFGLISTNMLKATGSIETSSNIKAKTAEIEGESKANIVKATTRCETKALKLGNTTLNEDGLKKLQSLKAPERAGGDYEYHRSLESPVPADGEYPIGTVLVLDLYYYDDRDELGYGLGGDVRLNGLIIVNNTTRLYYDRDATLPEPGRYYYDVRYWIDDDNKGRLSISSNDPLWTFGDEFQEGPVSTGASVRQMKISAVVI